MALAALEQIPLPPGSDQLAPLEPDEPANRNAKKPAAANQRSNTLQPLGNHDGQPTVKSGQKETQSAWANKGSQSVQKKVIKKKAGKKSGKAVSKSSKKKSKKANNSSGKRAKR